MRNISSISLRFLLFMFSKKWFKLFNLSTPIFNWFIHLKYKQKFLKGIQKWMHLIWIQNRNSYSNYVAKNIMPHLRWWRTTYTPAYSHVIVVACHPVYSSVYNNNCIRVRWRIRCTSPPKMRHCLRKKKG